MPTTTPGALFRIGARGLGPDHASHSFGIAAAVKAIFLSVRHSFTSSASLFRGAISTLYLALFAGFGLLFACTGC